MMFTRFQKTQRSLFLAMCCLQFILIFGCVPKNNILPTLSIIDYDSQGYLDVTIGPYALYLPSRFEDQHSLISKINSQISIEPFNGSLRISIPDQRFFIEAKDYYLFALIENPAIDKHEYPGEGIIEVPSPNSWDEKFYLNDIDFWQLNLKYDAYLWNFWLYKNGRYVLKISFDSRFKPTEKEIKMILSSVTKSD